ncbi:hypothetical protein [Spongiactinospora sp. TRM90649]|uniref:hypothetical protein n=1 Tax=Spongiactinospora sp. TRM90649 TaxID=3031114 RepID=UPI0023F706AD|nr:hypothetical protein [Spongiactinospora sp. TRM90649]MDF5751447.1 hypothetical protein [Spongiactinospora sp. TRM90649]
MEHFHAYRWVGQRVILDKEDGMRRTPIDLTDFAVKNSPFPPFRMCDYLLKAPGQICKTTASVEEAADWLAEQFDELAPSIAHPGRLEPDPRTSLLEEAVKYLSHADSVCRGYWLNGERYAVLAVVHCPDFHVPDYPCPAR